VIHAPATQKRTYTLARLGQDAAWLLGAPDSLRAAMHGGRVDKPFAEKIMLAVTQVNGCRWCHYAHVRLALKEGVSPQELHSLMALSLGDFPQEEAVALAFAQHYAESADQPDPAAWARVVETYGAATAGDILTLIRMITMGNLLGNTFDAFLSRLQGKPNPSSSLWNEVAVLGGTTLGTLPLTLLIGLRLLAGRLFRTPATPLAPPEISA
jgi:AhpD family alkylhydroperoxidase